ncbi:MAG: helix-turn-helix transcriptional regulator [Sphingomonadales bacterium]|nr:helix-turn-helix transcriptional regulator [Sphingomonadales bacterium]MBD3774975.1 helix-turn-helix transcriptional regulator [Paracoccaceae bacterium]
MQQGDLTTAAIESLSASELEILRLLASGHTAKSIARRLDRSEAAINERLRDARRKTGVGSSRELARMLAARKIWDKKIDLPGGGESGEDEAVPQERGRLSRKGVLIMLMSASLAAAAVLAVASPSLPFIEQSHLVDPEGAAGTADASPLVGRWSLETSRVPEAERPQAVTIDFSTDAGLKWTMAVAMTTADGTSLQSTATARADGKPVAVAGNMSFIDSASFRRPAAGTLVVTLGKGGKTVSTRIYAISRDRKTMTETIVWPNQSLPQLETNTFERAPG